MALLDYGQVKDLPDKLRLGYANLVLAIANRDPVRASESYRCEILLFDAQFCHPFCFNISE